MTPSFKLWYLLPEMKLGGTEKHVIRLISGLRDRGHDAGIVCLFREGIIANEVREQNIPFVCLDLEYCWNLKTLQGILKWLRQTRPDVLHTCLFGFDFFAALPARLLKIPAVISSRRELAHWQKPRHRWMQNLGNLFVDRVVCCSNAVRKWTLVKEKIGQEKVFTLYNGVDLERFRAFENSPNSIRKEFGIPQNASVVGTVANIAVEKGYSDLIAAAGLILKEKPETWFLFVGAGPLQEEMKAKAQALPHGEQIIFTGFRSDISELFRVMGIFTLASTIEGFPNVLLEAMAMGCPVVTTSIGGIPELVTSEKDGILVDAKNPGQLAVAILRLLNDPKKAREFGEQGWKKIRESFSEKRMIDQYETFYESVLRDKGFSFLGSAQEQNSLQQDACCGGGAH